MIENNMNRRRVRGRSIVPSNSLRSHFFALARQVRQWSDLRLELTEAGPQQRGPVIGVTSLERGAGTSTVSFNLACALASLSKANTLLVESDFGRHYVTRRLGHSRAPGLAEMLLDVATPEETIFATPIANVSVMGCGTKSDQEALELPFESLSPILNETLTDYQYTIFDLPLASELSACHSIGPHLDGIILTVESNLIDQRRITRFRKKVENYGGEVIGIVLNKS